MPWPAGQDGQRLAEDETGSPTERGYAEASTETEMVIEPYDALITACNGEDVALSGELLFIFHDTVDAGGGFHSTFIVVPKDVRGVGSETGLNYKAVGGTREQYSFTKDNHSTYTNTSMYNLVSQGGSENLRARFTFHITFNADGDPVVEVDHSSESCVF